VFLGIEREDTHEDADYLVEKVINLRIFEDREGKMNLSLVDISGGLLVVSQFTLWEIAERGRRPSFIRAEDPVPAKNIIFIFSRRLPEKIESCGRRRIPGDDEG